MSTLTGQIRKAAGYDETDTSLDAAEFYVELEENKRLQPLIEALIRFVDIAEIIDGVSQHDIIDKAILNLEDVLMEME